MRGKERAILARGVPKGILFQSGRGCWRWFRASHGTRVWRRRTKVADVLDEIAATLCIRREELTTTWIMPEHERQKT